jgi:hypothetical protein
MGSAHASEQGSFMSFEPATWTTLFDIAQVSQALYVLRRSRLAMTFMTSRAKKGVSVTRNVKRFLLMGTSLQSVLATA